MTIKYFDDIQFVNAGNCAESRTLFVRRFADYYGLQYSQDGAFLVELDTGFKRVVSGAWVLITYPGPLFRYGAPLGGWRRHAFVCFRGRRVDEYIRNGLLPLNRRDPLVRITRPERFYAALAGLIAMLQPLSAAPHARAVHCLEDILLQLHEQPPPGRVAADALAREFTALTAAINADPGRDWDFHKAAREMHISFSHFRRLFRRFIGMAPGKWLLCARLCCAAEQIAGTDRSLKSIAFDSGFEDALYFSRMFKKHYRVSPRRYRAEFG